MVAGTYDVRWAIFTILILAAANHGYVISLARTHEQAIIIGSRAKFYENSLSCSLLIVAVAIEAGITDIYTLLSIFALSATTWWFGYIAQLEWSAPLLLLLSQTLRAVSPAIAELFRRLG
jgi:hypothetical protein